MNTKHLMGKLDEILVAAIILALTFLVTGSLAKQPAAGTLTVKVTTVSYGGKYAQKNVGAIWISDSKGAFVKTLEVWANKREKHLVAWNAASGGKKVDAITSATSRSHVAHEATWNCTDAAGTLVPDGAYEVHVEFTEDNSSSSGTPDGKLLTLPFTKGGTAFTQTPPDMTYFKSIELIYELGGPPPAASLSGAISDATSGSAVAGATVRLSEASQIKYEATSDGTGNYDVQNIAPGAYTLAVTHDGHNPASQAVSLAAGEHAIKDFRLEPVVAGASLAGVVKDGATASALAGVVVQLLRNNLMEYETTTGADGAFQFNAVAPGQYTLLARKAGYIEARIAVSLASGQAITNEEVLLQHGDSQPPAAPGNLQVRQTN